MDARFEQISNTLQELLQIKKKKYSRLAAGPSQRSLRPQTVLIKSGVLQPRYWGHRYSIDCLELVGCSTGDAVQHHVCVTSP